MLIQTLSHLDQILWNRDPMPGILQQMGDGMSPPLSSHGEKQSFDRLFGRLMGCKASPVIIPILQGVPGMVQIMEGLRQPVESTVCHFDPPIPLPTTLGPALKA